MSLPSSASKANCDSTGDDPKLALTVDLADLVDKFNTLLTHLSASGITLGGTTAAAGIGEGLESDGDAASPLLRVKVVSTGGISRAAGGLSLDVSDLSAATPTQAANLAFEDGSGTKKARLAGSGTSLVGIAAATQAQMEAESSVETIVMPSRMKYHPGVAKAWVVFNGTGSNPITKDAGYNISGTITKNGTGDYTITWSTAFSSANYAYSISAEAGASDNVFGAQVKNGGKAAGSLRISFLNGSGSPFDPPSVSVQAFGDQ